MILILSVTIGHPKLLFSAITDLVVKAMMAQKGFAKFLFFKGGSFWFAHEKLVLRPDCIKSLPS